MQRRPPKEAPNPDPISMAPTLERALLQNIERKGGARLHEESHHSVCHHVPSRARLPLQDDKAMRVRGAGRLVCHRHLVAHPHSALRGSLAPNTAHGCRTLHPLEEHFQSKPRLHSESASMRGKPAAHRRLSFVPFSFLLRISLTLDQLHSLLTFQCLHFQIRRMALCSSYVVASVAPSPLFSMQDCGKTHQRCTSEKEALSGTACRCVTLPRCRRVNAGRLSGSTIRSLRLCWTRRPWMSFPSPTALSARCPTT